MDSKPIGRVAVMSIHPEFAEAIFAGNKQVEFRKRRLPGDVTHVIVYATAPVKAVVGAFSIAGQDTSTPSTLWRRFSSVAGISRARFFEYFAASAHGTGIKVGKILVTDGALPLNTALGIQRPPQSYQYLCPNRARSVLMAMEDT